MKPHTNHNHNAHMEEPRASAPASAPSSSSFGLYIILVFAICLGISWGFYSDYKAEQRYAAEARAEIAQYRHSDPTRALAVYCREARTTEDRIRYCY